MGLGEWMILTIENGEAYELAHRLAEWTGKSVIQVAGIVLVPSCIS